MATLTGTPDQAPVIMIVDDKPENLGLLEQMIHDAGYRPVAFPNGSLALKAASKSPPDVILLDIMMPEMDGFELCHRLKADPALREIPILFISALDETIGKIRAFEAGAVDYVTKPLQEKEVLARIATHLRIARLQNLLKDHNESLEIQVAERTRDLDRAYARLRQVDQLKTDFFRMISHEVRTPAAGVLGLGELLLDLCPPGDETDEYRELFHRAADRLHALVEDATMIADMDKVTAKGKGTTALPNLLGEVRKALPGTEILVPGEEELANTAVSADPALLTKAMVTFVRLAASFRADKTNIRLDIETLEEELRIRATLGNLALSPEQTAEFFSIESPVRASSKAESLGLAPVVARSILTAFGGELRLMTGEGGGCLEARLTLPPSDQGNGQLL